MVVDPRRRNRELQVRFYGEPLGDRLRRLIEVLGVRQGDLAVALGASPSMLSQLMNGRRARIGSPDVLGRLLLLEQRVAAGATEGTTAHPAHLLAEVRACEPPAVSHLAGPNVREAPHLDPALDSLRTVAAPDELARAAETLDHAFPTLAGLLRRAAAPPHPGAAVERRG